MAELRKNPSVQLMKFEHKLEQSADLIHYPGVNPFILSVPLLNSLPFVVTIHDLIPLKFPIQYPPGIKGWLNWLIQKNLLRFSRAIITDSYASKQDILCFTALPAVKVHVVYLAPDLIFKPIQPSKNFNLPKKFVLYVGDVNYNKNLPFLAAACLKMNYPLVVVGKQAIQKNYDHQHPENQALVEFQALVAANPGKIIPLGFVSNQDLVQIYNSATLYVQPSLAEGFGLPVLEAMACGCPVLSSRVGSLAEIGGKADLKFSPENLTRCWQSTALRLKLSHQGIAQAKHFSWRKTAQETLKFMNKLFKTGLILALVVRLYLQLIAVLALKFIPFKASFPYSDFFLSPKGPDWLWLWGNFDGVHYISIAIEGYLFGLTQAFFPFYPLLIRWLSLITHNQLWSGLIISHFCFIGFLYYFIRLGRLDYPAKTVSWAVLLLILFPTSWFFFSVYTESLFLLLAALSLYLARTRRFTAAVLLAGIASGTRLVGIFLLPAILWEYFQAVKKPKIHTLALLSLTGISGFYFI